MKKKLVKMTVNGTEYGKVYQSVNIVPNGVEGYDPHNTRSSDVCKQINITKEWRDRAYADKAIAEVGTPSGWCAHKDSPLIHVEIGVETITHDDFNILGVTVVQEAQRWFCNIFGVSNNSSVAIVRTSDTIGGVLDAVNELISDFNLYRTVMIDVVYNLITSDNLDFIAKVTAERGESADKRDAKQGKMRCIYNIENREQLLMGIMTWLFGGDQHATKKAIEDIDRSLSGECRKSTQVVYDAVDKKAAGLTDKSYQPLFEAVLAKLIDGYVPRVMSMDDLERIGSSLEAFVGEALSDLKKDRREPYVGGYYIGGGDDSKDKYLTKYIRLPYDLEDCFDRYGYEIMGRMLDIVMQKRNCRYHSVSNAIKSSDKHNGYAPYTELMMIVQKINNDAVAVEQISKADGFDASGLKEIVIV